eukprot:SAG11_NODE_327_length_10699_cov_4.828272_9_plen_553_part_00
MPQYLSACADVVGSEAERRYADVCKGIEVSNEDGTPSEAQLWYHHAFQDVLQANSDGKLTSTFPDLTTSAETEDQTYCMCGAGDDIDCCPIYQWDRHCRDSEGNSIPLRTQADCESGPGEWDSDTMTCSGHTGDGGGRQDSEAQCTESSHSWTIDADIPTFSEDYPVGCAGNADNIMEWTTPTWHNDSEVCSEPTRDEDSCVTPEFSWEDAQALECQRVDFEGVFDRGVSIDAVCYACYCNEDSPTGLPTVAETIDGEEVDYCQEWSDEQSHKLYFGLLATIIVVIVNQILKQTLLFVTRFERNETQSFLEASLANKIFICQFLNTAILFLIVRSRLITSIPGDHFANVNAKWYANFGAPLAQTMLIQYVTNPVTELVMVVVPELMKCFLEKSAGTQNKLNALYRPKPLLMSVRYSEMLLCIGVTLLFGSAVPLLYLVAFFGLTLRSMVDYYVVLRFYKRPPLYDEELFANLPYILFFFLIAHECFAVYFFSVAGQSMPTEDPTFNPFPWNLCMEETEDNPCGRKGQPHTVRANSTLFRLDHLIYYPKRNAR